jgi:penicillin-binding protein 1A
VGKTGTTNDAKDAWFAGYSSDLVAAVWVGYDDALPLGPGEAGGATALPSWIEFMQAAHANKPAVEFARPAGVVVAQVDPATGLLPAAGQDSTLEEEFLDGTVPSVSAAEANAELNPTAEGAPSENAANAPDQVAPPPGNDEARSKPAELAQGADGGAPSADEPPPF